MPSQYQPNGGSYIPPQQLPGPYQEQQPYWPQQPNPSSDGNGLAILGLILSIVPFTSLIGLVISIIALVKSPKGQSPARVISIIGIVLASLGMVISTLFSLVILGSIVEEYGQGTPTASESTHSTPSTPETDTEANREDSGSSQIDIAGVKNEVNGQELSTACFTATMPEGYILSPKHDSCFAQISGDMGNDQYMILLSILVLPQTGVINMELAEAAFNTYGDNVISIEETTVNGLAAIKINTRYDSTFMVPTTYYIIIDDSGKFVHDGKTITSYMISAPTGLITSENGEADIDTFVKSFRLN